MSSTSGASTPRGASASMLSTETAMGRKVVAGQCSAFVQSGRMILDCVCPRGEFDIRCGGWDAEGEQVECGYCSHDLLHHADVAKSEDEVIPHGDIPGYRSTQEDKWGYDTSSTTGTNTPTTSTSRSSTPSGTSTPGVSIAAESRKVLAGPCAAFVVSGRMKLACVCPSGDFELRSGACSDDLECRYCCHGLEDHEDFSDLTEDTDSLAASLRSVMGNRAWSFQRHDKAPEATSISDSPPSWQGNNETNKPQRSRQNQSVVEVENGRTISTQNGQKKPSSPPAVHDHVLPPDVTRGEIPRTRTVQGLLSLLIENRVVQIMGPPYSGKSTLAKQLESFTRKNVPQLAVHRFSWPGFSYPVDSSPGDLFQWVAGLDVAAESKHRQVLLIIEDVQKAFRYERLWGEFVRHIFKRTGGPLLIAAFGTFVTPHLSTDSSQGRAMSREAFRTFGHQLSLVSAADGTQAIPSLYYSFSECLQASRLHFADTRSGHGLAAPFIPDDALARMIWHYSEGHPYVTRIIVELIRTSVDPRSHCPPRDVDISEKIGLQARLVTLAEVYPLSKILAPRDTRQRTPTEFWMPVAGTSSFEPNLMLDMGVRCLALGAACTPRNGQLESTCTFTELLENRGWIKAKPKCFGDPEYSFATPFHRNYIEYLLVSSDEQGITVQSLPGGVKSEKTEKTIVMSAKQVRQPGRRVIRANSPKFAESVSFLLSSILYGMSVSERTLSHRTQRREKNRSHYRNVFYKAAGNCTGGFHLYKDEDVPAGTKVHRARLHFTMPKACCSFDVTYDGENMDYYTSMFKKDGAMYKWAKDQSVWWTVVLDIRSFIPVEIRSVAYPWLYHVLFIQDRITILNAALEDVTNHKNWVHKGCMHKRKTV